MWIDRLQCLGVFACRCHVLADEIRVGILLNGGEWGREIMLCDPLTNRFYHCEIPLVPRSYNVSLKRIEAHE